MSEESCLGRAVAVQLKGRRRDLDGKILETARKHFAEDFPNPERRGCPPMNEIKLLADKPFEGKDWVLDHIGFCSPCYRDFAHFLRAGRKKFGVKSNRND
jgi:hypothetical protein